ncbi:MAG TPA: hypothetical protein VEB21_17025 [Terriglobales bacterium]|nr:hypothetical protein [Terriglobales bacterium]
MQALQVIRRTKLGRLPLQAVAISLILAACSSAKSDQYRSGANGGGPGEAVLATTEVKEILSVSNVRATNHKVTGTLTNRSPKTLRDVQLMIQHTWLWKNERNPGKNNPGRTEFYQILEDIPPNETISFEYRPQPPLPQRKDGHFETHVAVTSFTEVGD